MGSLDRMEGLGRTCVPVEERKCKGIIENWELYLDVECKSQTVLDKSPSSSSTQARGKKEQVD